MRRHELLISVLRAFLLSLPLSVSAQQDPIYALYFNNPLTINPAYAGANSMLNATVQYRTQWAGIDSKPSTINFNSHMSVLNNKGGVGLMVLQDRIGETKSTEVSTMYAYKIKLNWATMSFGMQAGFTRYTSDPALLTIRDSGDPSFNPIRATNFNVGSGLLFKGEQWVAGISAPRMLPASVTQSGTTINLYDQNYYLFGSYGFFVSEKFRIRPSVLLRAAKGLPLSADINASVVIQENYSAGLLTRGFKTYGFQFVAVINDLKLGYVLELPGSSASSLHFTSHEFMLSLSMGVMRYHDRVNKL
ncbi:MAG TPA: PorP/SprF family type IX secretion system membrane protein [Cyclobacteriaceae bacterium]|nr:PorP/SprF family type IX secretion system membrane protein [Cyclobacteriaceae bacterium]